MATKSHKTLTGNQLHEPKGADTAADDYVMTVTSNSAVWKKLTANNLTGTGNSFGGQLFHVREQRADNTVPSPFTLTTGWQGRAINTSVVNEISGASLASNQITLPSGTYFVYGTAPLSLLHSSGFTTYVRSKLAIYVASAPNYILNGPVIGSTANFSGVNGSTEICLEAQVSGRFALAGTQTIELRQHIYSNTTVNAGFSSGTSTGTNDVYSELFIWKVS